jgi:hypothetical protein
MTLEDGTYELVPEPEQGISRDQVHVDEDLTEAPNQSSEVIDILDPSPTQEGKPRCITQLWQNQPELHRFKYASPLSRAPTYFKRCNPLACRVKSR